MIVTTIPKHRHELTISIGAHDFSELQRVLRQVADELIETGGRVVVGSSSYAGHFEHIVTPDQTREKYIAELTASIEAADADVRELQELNR